MVNLLEIVPSIKRKITTYRTELEEAWRQSDLELAADAYGYNLYLDMEAGKLTTEEFNKKIEESKETLAMIWYMSAMEHNMQRSIRLQRPMLKNDKISPNFLYPSEHFFL